MSYTLGIDIGIASLGFAGVNVEEKKISFCGVHLFEAAENPKDGSSLAQPRREKRSQRRVICRRAQRKQAIRRLLAEYGLESEIDQIHESIHPENSPTSPWDWRRVALERLLTDSEFFGALFHIAKRRGFESNRKGKKEDDLEGKKALGGAKELQEAMSRAQAPTIGAYLSTLPKKRNGRNSYENFVTRDLLREEVRCIFDAQRRLGNPKATEILQRKYEELAFTQRPLQSSEKLVGYCTLEPTEKRAPKFSYSAELFILWSKINNTKIRTMKGAERFLTQDEKEFFTKLAHKNREITYRRARKELKLTEQERFNISYRSKKLESKDTQQSWEDIRDNTEKTVFLKMPGYHSLKTALCTENDSDWLHLINNNHKKLNDIAHVLSFYEDEKQIRNILSGLNLRNDDIDNLIKITNFSKTVDLSLKVIERILPHLQDGMTYDKACKEAGYHHSSRKNLNLGMVPTFDDTRNPVVNRALGQARKVINAIIRRHGMPEKIIIEMARDMGRSYKDRKALEREIKGNETYRNAAREHMAEILGIPAENIRGGDILKYRLWKEQKGYCPYSGIYIPPESLQDSAATQIDHIIPYHRSWNDSYMNKLLCITSENQDKKDDTPIEYFSRMGRNIKPLEEFVRRLPKKKAENILIEDFDEEKRSIWKERALNDTRYMSKLLKNHLETSLALGKGQCVQTRNGALTAHLRRLWGFPDKDRQNDRHHAIDAIVLACSTQAIVQKVANWYRSRKTSEKPRVTSPWDSFREDTQMAVSRVRVSRMPVRKITGAAHEETIRSIRETGKTKQIIQRTEISKLSLKDLENIVDKERNHTLYNTLKKRLKEHNDDGKKAFSEPVYMPTKNLSKQGPLITSVRIVTTEKSGVAINHGLASNGSMVRVDVYYKQGKGGGYYLVPVYVHHFVGNELPNKAILSKKLEEMWKEMDEKDFLFSLYRNDFVQIQTKKGEKISGYYIGTHRGNGSISLQAHDNDPYFGEKGIKKGIGVKTLLSFEKYAIDYFGNITPKNSPGIRERRIGVIRKKERKKNNGLAQRHDSKSSEITPFKEAAIAD